MTQPADSRAGAGGGPVFCPECGRPITELGKDVMRRESDWYGVRLQLHEKVVIGALIALCNGFAALTTILLTRFT